jgi:kynurenine formamidase
MKDYTDNSWLENNVWGKWGKDDEFGALNELSAADVIKAVSLIKTGKVYDLETERFKGMPTWPGHAAYEFMSYATPRGRRNMVNSEYYPDQSWFGKGGWLEKNPQGIAANTEIMVTPLHVGTHIDALCHITAGEDAHWYNGFNQDEHSGDFGPLKTDMPKIKPIVCRGVLLDIPGSKGIPHLPPNYGITIKDIEECIAWSGVELRKNDAVLLHTGQRWPELDTCPNTGVIIESVRYLVEEKGCVLIGNDTVSLESIPSPSIPEHVHPVHHYMLIQQGMHMIELVQTAELAADKCYEFCFICTPSKFRGATGVFVRPIAIV